MIYGGQTPETQGPQGFPRVDRGSTDSVFSAAVYTQKAFWPGRLRGNEADLVPWGVAFGRRLRRRRKGMDRPELMGRCEGVVVSRGGSRLPFWLDLGTLSCPVSVPGVCTLTTASATWILSRDRMSSMPVSMAGLRGVRVGRCTIRSEPAVLVPGPCSATAVVPCHRAEGCRAFPAPWPHRFAVWQLPGSSPGRFPRRLGCRGPASSGRKRSACCHRLHPLGRHLTSLQEQFASPPSGLNLLQLWPVLLKARPAEPMELP